MSQESAEQIIGIDVVGQTLVQQTEQQINGNGTKALTVPDGFTLVAYDREHDILELRYENGFHRTESNFGAVAKGIIANTVGVVLFKFIP